MKIELLGEVGSTSEYIKQYLAGGEDRVVCADRQSGGKGTKGRRFLSERGGVYLSVLRFYRGLPSAEAFRVMANAATAVCRTAEAFGASPEIKWPNDVFCRGKKLCGILTENVISGGEVRASVVGIGLNVRNPLTGLEEIAVRLADVCVSPPTVEEARERLIEEYFRESSFEEYLSYVHFLGKDLTVEEDGRRYSAIARRVLPDGRLEAECGGKVVTLSAAEISVRW